MRRTDLQDTAPWAYRALVERLRTMSPEDKCRMIFDRIETGRQIQALAEARKPKP